MDTEIILKSVDEIIPYANNPRRNDKAVDAVAESIKQFGFKQPIVIDGGGVVVCGHTRLKAAKKLGIKTVPCIVAEDLTPEQIKAYRLADNKTAELAEWDMELLPLELDDLQEFDMTLFGFETPKGKAEVIEDDYEITVPAEPRTKPGEIYQLGRDRLMCGDSTSVKCVQALAGGGTNGHASYRPPVQRGVHR